MVIQFLKNEKYREIYGKNYFEPKINKNRSLSNICLMNPGKGSMTKGIALHMRQPSFDQGLETNNLHPDSAHRGCQQRPPNT